MYRNSGTGPLMAHREGSLGAGPGPLLAHKEGSLGAGPGKLQAYQDGSMGGCSSCSGGVGEYFAASGIGEYFSANGLGEYFSANGLGEATDASTVVPVEETGNSNMGLIIGGVAVAAVAAGFLLFKKKK